MYASTVHRDEHATRGTFKRVGNEECVFRALECLFRLFGDAADLTPAEQTVSAEEGHFDVETLAWHVAPPAYRR
jgi:hypothetical protein